MGLEGCRIRMTENIFLIGFMGAGKSTIAKELQGMLHMNLVEMDARIVKKSLNFLRVLKKNMENIIIYILLKLGIMKKI